MEFSWQEYWHELPFPSPGDLPNLGIEPTTWQVDSLPLSQLGRQIKSLELLNLLISISCLLESEEGCC